MLKRFIVFTGHKDEVQSGWNSIDSHFDTLEEALARGNELTGENIPRDEDGEYLDGEDHDDIESDLWCQIVDTDADDGTGKVVKEMGYEVP